jgi:hypothetical protein
MYIETKVWCKSGMSVRVVKYKCISKRRSGASRVCVCMSSHIHVYRNEGLVQVGNECACRQIYMYIETNSVDFQNPIRWYPIGRNMITPPTVLSPSSILPPTSFPCAFTAPLKKLGAILKMLLFQFFKLYTNCLSLKFSKLGCVCKPIY